MKKKLLILYTAVGLMLCLKTTASALTEMEILVDKLVEKNILTPAEGDKILRETKKKQRNRRKKPRRQWQKCSPQMGAARPSSTATFRLRYQYVEIKEQRPRARDGSGCG